MRFSALSRDLISAYLAAGARAGSWIILTALLFRTADQAEFAMLALVRGSIGLLAYSALGLGPAMIRQLAQRQHEMGMVYRAGQKIARSGALVGLFLVVAYAVFFRFIHSVPLEFRFQMPLVVAAMGMGMLLRILSEPSSAVIQTSGQLFRDNLIVMQGEILWIVLSMTGVLLLPRLNPSVGPGQRIALVATAFAIASGYILLRRVLVVRPLLGSGIGLGAPPKPLVVGLLKFGLLVAIAQFADFLYAPTDFILINRFLDPTWVAVYTPAVQIDSGLLLLVSGTAAILLPRAAIAHADRQPAALRRYYITGTLGTTALLLIGALLVWAIAPWLLHAWLRRDLPLTLAVLPLILLHTVVGGSSAVGRSVLLAMGKVRDFSISVLIAGFANVILSYLFAVPLKMGLWGIVLGSVIAVVARCGFWTPWYVLRVLRHTQSDHHAAADGSH